MISHLLGFFASTIAFVLWLPQARSTWVHRGDARALAALSPGTYWLVLVNATTWGIYGVLTGALWVGAPGLVNGPLAVITLYLIYRARVSPALERRCPCGQWDLDPHDFLVTAPPMGYGTVHSPCTGATTRGFAVPYGNGRMVRENFPAITPYRTG